MGEEAILKTRARLIILPYSKLIKPSSTLYEIWLGWVGLGWVGLGWVGLGWVGLGWVGLS